MTSGQLRHESSKFIILAESKSLQSTTIRNIETKKQLNKQQKQHKQQQKRTKQPKPRSQRHSFETRQICESKEKQSS